MFVGNEAAKQMPLLASAVTLAMGWLSTYGAALVTLLSLVYAVAQLYFMFRDKAGWFGGKKGKANVSD